MAELLADAAPKDLLIVRDELAGWIGGGQKPIAVFPANKHVPASSHFGRGAALGLAIVLLLALVPRALASYLDREGANGSLPAVQLSTLPGCSSIVSVPVPAFDRAASQPAQIAAQTYRCGADLFTLNLQLFPARVGARAVFSGLNRLRVEPGWELIGNRTLEVRSGPQAQRWSQSEYRGSRQRRRTIASAVWVGGRPAYGLKGRIRQALNIFRPATVPTILAQVDFVSSASAADARRAMDRFLQSTQELPLQIAATTQARD